MKVYIINDTSKSPYRKHAGSIATMKALRALLSDHEIIGRHCAGLGGPDEKLFDECDAVVCNGEGTMHHNAMSMRLLMGILDRAQKAGKKTVLVNSVWDSNTGFDNILKKLDFASFREVLSLKSAGVGVVRKDLVFNNKYIIPSLIRHKTLTDKNFPLEGDFQELIYKIADCKLFKTSKYHGVILAIISKTPFTVLPGANTHKIKGFLKTYDNNIDVQNLTKEDLNEAFNRNSSS